VPRFTSNGPTSTFEATTATPYLGTTLAGKYAPNATDVVQGDVSAAIVTYLAATNAPLDLATYVFPLGATNISHVVANSFDVAVQQAVTIIVRTAPRPT
jgi:glutamyl-tRNA reductase